MIMENRNYQKELDKLIISLEGRRPKLLLHVCCAPCSSYCTEYLAEYFDISLFYYNPNMDTLAEYEKRAAELKRLVRAAGFSVNVLIMEYEPGKFRRMALGLENVREGGERCFKCYELRMREAAEYAASHGFDYFTTTLSISPLKNAAKINEIGEKLAAEYGVPHLPSDFKKRGGYQRSIELSHQYDLYRQNYCGCIYSKPTDRPESLS